MVPCIGNDDLGAELFPDVSNDSREPFFGGNQETAMTLETLSKKGEGFMV